MSNQHDGSLKAACLAAAKTEQGLKTDGLPGYTRLQVGRMVQKLTNTGHLFVAKLSHRYARYFDTMAKAEAFEALHKGKPVPGVVIKKSKAWDVSAPAVNPLGIEPKRDAAPRQRFAPDDGDESWQTFSKLKPGQYITEPSSCAARAFS